MASANRIKGITIELDGDTTKLTQAIKKSESEIRSATSGLKDVNNLLKMDPGNTELLTQKYNLLQQEIGGAKDKLQTLKDAQAQMASEGKVGTDEYNALQREITDTEQKIKSLTKEIKNFGSVGAQQVAAVGEKMKDLGGKMETAGQKLLPLTAALTAAGTVGVQKFAEVDKTMTLTNQTMGNTAEEAKLLSDSMKEAAANSTFGMNDAATASLNFARAGLSAAEAAAALAPAMNLAAGEGGNLDVVSAGLVGTINGFGDSFDNTTHYADVFAAACNNSALDVDGLSNAMGVAAPVFKSAGYTVEDAALYLGILADKNIEATEAANGLKTGITRLVAPAKQGKEMMMDLGLITEDAGGKLVNAFTNADGSMKSTIEVQQILHDKFADLSESEQIAAASAIFGKNQMSKWLALINTAPEEVQALSDQLTDCAGTTQEMADAMMSGFGGSLEKLKSSIDVAATSLGEALAPTISKIAEAVQKAVDWFNSLDESQQQMIAKIGLVVAALGPVLIIGGKIVGGLGSILTLAPKVVGAFGSVGGAISGFVGKAGSAASTATSATSSISKIGSSAGTAASGMSSAGTAMGTLTQNALGFIALGAGILLAAAGIALLAQSAIALAKAGPEAGLALLALVGTMALFAAGAAALGPALTAGAVGLVAFGAAVALVGVGVLAACAGLTLLAGQLPTIVQYGGQAAVAIAQLGAALVVFAAGCTSASGGLTLLAAGLLLAAAGLGTATVAMLAFTVAVLALSAGMVVLTASTTALAVAIGLLAAAILALGVSINTSTKLIIESFRLIKKEAEDTFNGMLKIIETVLGSIYKKVEEKFGKVKEFIKGVVEWLKKAFDFEWKLPDIKLPHFKIDGKFSLDPPSMPKISVDWYSKAMENGMILNSPTIFGAAGGKLLGGGEAGSEAIVGTGSLQNMITSAVAAAGVGGDIVIPVYVGNQKLETMVVQATQISNYRSGGR